MIFNGNGFTPTRFLGALVVALALTFSLSPAGALAAGSHDPSEHGRLLGLLKPRTGGAIAPSAPGNLLYHGGPVMHSNTTYAIYWTGPEELIPDSYESTIDKYFEDVAADSGRDQNVYSLTGQYADGSGSAAYNSTFGGSFNDTETLPTDGCEYSLVDFCVTDAQVREELDSFITAHELPRGFTALYFVFLPEDFGTCGGGACAYSDFCAYHDHFGSGSGTTLYANQPWGDFVPIGYGNSVCGSQPSPNGYPEADHELSIVSHEHNEAITDPLGNAWFDSSGNENGDKCAYQFGPSLGTTDFGAFNQAIFTGRYEIQLEWSNASSSCEARGGDANLPPVASFSPPPAPTVNVAGKFDASSSYDEDGEIVSYSWDFGDGTTGSGEFPSHTYASSGAKTVTLTVTDDGGSKTTEQSTIHVLGIGCQANELPPNDDGSTAEVALPFALDFFGQKHSSLFVNNNGNITFDTPLSTYTPFDLTSTETEIIAPFFGDVDTRGAGSGVTTYGSVTYGGHAAFCVGWGDAKGVGYFDERDDKLNRFELLLVDRGDIQAGDFDIIMSYGQIQWETGEASGGTDGLGGASARVGYSNGTGEPGTFFELPGSAVNGAFLDSNPDTGLIHGSRGSLTPGRYVYEVRNGEAPSGGSFQGLVKRPNGDPVAHAPVQACPQSGGSCVTSQSNNAGAYTIAGLDPDTWTLTASPPAGDASSLPGSVTTGLAADEHKTGVDIVLPGAAAPPGDTTITSRGVWADGEPVLYWGEPLLLRTHGCSGGTAQYTITVDGAQIRAGSLTEDPGQPGLYTATIEPLYPNHGYAQFHVTIACPNSSEDEDDTWSAYIDPSGAVTTPEGEAIAGATVTLYRSDSSAGPFVQLAEGDAAMSPENRRNPDVSDAAGHFGWDVVAGYYRVRAEKSGCHAPGSAGPYVESGVLSIPPPVTDLHLVLVCSSAPSGGKQPTPATESAAGGGATEAPPGSRCAGATGRKLAACVRAKRLSRRLAACQRMRGRKRAQCRGHAIALSKCEAKKGRARKRCMAGLKAPRRKR